MLFSHSPKAKLLWKEQTGRSVTSYSATRWWSRWEVYHQLLLQFGDIELFLQRHDDLGPASRHQLMAFFQDPQKTALLKIELTSIIDWGEAFVKATYHKRFGAITTSPDREKPAHSVNRILPSNTEASTISVISVGIFWRYQTCTWYSTAQSICSHILWCICR